MTRLILIRHGQTEWNLKKKYCGFTDVPLNLTGKEQIKCLRRRLDSEIIHRVYASDLTRAVESAGILFPGTKIEQFAGLREMCFGVFEGLTYAQIMEQYPVVYQKWLNAPYVITIPKAESLKSFCARISRAISGLITLNRGKTIAVVCHGGAISVFINKIMKSNDFWGYIPDSASMSIIEYNKGKPEIKFFNLKGA